MHQQLKRTTNIAAKFVKLFGCRSKSPPPRQSQVHNIPTFRPKAFVPPNVLPKAPQESVLLARNLAQLSTVATNFSASTLTLSRLPRNNNKYEVVSENTSKGISLATIWNDPVNDWSPIVKSSDTFNTHVPLKYNSDYLKNIPTEESILEFGPRSRKSSGSACSALDFGETLKSECTFVSRNNSILRSDF